jgi:hypothetical protein
MYIDVNGQSSIQQEEEFPHWQIGLKFKEGNSEMLHF